MCKEKSNELMENIESFNKFVNEAKDLSKKEVKDLKIKINNASTIGKYFTKDEVKFLTSLFESEVNEASDEDKPYFDFLLALRDSGATNMFGATPYLQSEFGLSKSEARKILAKWMKSF